MKMITAVIKPFKLEEVREALAECGVTGLAVARCTPCAVADAEVCATGGFGS